MNSHILPGARSRSARTHTPRRALVAAAVLAAAAFAPVVGATHAAGLPPGRPTVAPAGAPASATSRRSLMPENVFPALALVDIDLCATTGTTQIPRASGTTPDTVPVWGYVAGDCTTGAGTAALGGAPVVTVTEGDTVTVTLHNDLVQATSLTFQGQTMPTDRTGAAPGGTRSYVVHADRPGTFLYEAGFAGNTASQVAMGLHGVLVVNPATPGQAYGSATTAFDQSAIVLISEIDPALNANPTTFDMRKFAPKWTALNGTVFSTSSALATVAPGDALLLRYVNAGANYHSMTVLGGNQRIIADDGSPLTHDYSVVAQTIGPGQTTDAIVDISAAAPDGSMLTLYDANLQNRNRNRRPAATGTFRTYGGAIRFISVSATPTGTDTVGPVSSGATADGGTGVVTATVSDASTGASDVAAAEYSIDTVAPAGTGTPMSAVDAAFDSATEPVTATIPPGTLGSLVSGVHTVYVRGRDSAGNWGVATATSFRIDLTGPVASGVTMTPNPTPGSGSVALHATGSDATTGGATVSAAEYFIDAPVVDGTGTAMAVNNPLVTASLDATVSAVDVGALADGSHTVSVHALDSLGNWGPAATATLVVDRSGPVTTGGAAAPNPTNGLIGVNSSTAAVRVTATAGDSAGTVTKAEGFFDAVGAPGTGFPMVPTDGAWGSATEALTVDVPLATIRSLSDGSHTIHLRARDATGNWGPTLPVALTVDKVAPALTTLGVTTGANTATVSVNATDGLTGVQRVEYYVDTDPGQGAATVMPLLSGSTYSAPIPVVVLAEGAHTVVVRARDTAGTWSTVTTSLTVVRTLAFSTTGNTNPPGVAGTADNADVYLWNGAFSRAVDVTAITNPLPGGANVDGLVRVDNTHFYVSFADDVTILLPGPDLTVQDEDIAYYNAGVWSVYFDGTGAGLTGVNLDIDAFDIVGSTVYFSTVGNANPPTVAGAADDADVYSWNGSAFARVLDVTTVGVPAGANVDGLAVVDASHLFISFAADATVTGPGVVQDEDVIYRDGGVWRAWFDGTAKGLTNANHDLDAIDVP